jgi:hypothetical protein
MALTIFEMRADPWDVRPEPLTMGERHRQVCAALPDHRWDRNLVEVEAPRLGESQVVIEPAIDTCSQRLMKPGLHVLGELVGQDRPIDLGQDDREHRDDPRGGRFPKELALRVEIATKRRLSIPEVQSNPGASNGATAAIMSAAAVSSTRAAHASACGPPPDQPAMTHRSAPISASSAEVSPATSTTLRPG